MSPQSIPCHAISDSGSGAPFVRSVAVVNTNGTDSAAVEIASSKIVMSFFIFVTSGYYTNACNVTASDNGSAYIIFGSLFPFSNSA